MDVCPKLSGVYFDENPTYAGQLPFELPHVLATPEALGEFLTPHPLSCGAPAEQYPQSLARSKALGRCLDKCHTYNRRIDIDNRNQKNELRSRAQSCLDLSFVPNPPTDVLAWHPRVSLSRGGQLSAMGGRITVESPWL